MLAATAERESKRAAELEHQMTDLTRAQQENSKLQSALSKLNFTVLKYWLVRFSPSFPI